MELGIGKKISELQVQYYRCRGEKISSFNPELSIRLLDEINKWLVHIILKNVGPLFSF